MVDESGSPRASRDVDPDEDDEEEYGESGGENRLLGFMFGNVDNSGDLDVDYLDEDAKEHLAALADKLGSSLTDIDLSTKSPESTADAAEQDYDEKAEDAVDYEDIDEQYEGPETVAVSEEDHLLPKQEFYSSTISLSSLEHKTSLFDDENYDEDEEIEKEENVEAKNKQGDQPGTVSQDMEDDLGPYSLESEDMAADMTDSQETELEVSEDPFFGKRPTALPILCVEDGMVILRFSEIFCINNPPKKVERRGRRYSTPRDRYTPKDSSNVVEEDEETFLRGSWKGFSSMKLTDSSQEDLSICIDDDSESAMLDAMHGVATTALIAGERKIDSCLCAEPMKEDLPFIHSLGTGSPIFYPFDQQDWEDSIIWDDTPVMSVNSSESGENSGIDSDTLVFRETTSDSRPQNLQLELPLKSDENGQALFLRNTAVLVESIGSRNYSKSIDFPYPGRRYHPQLLRLESQLESDNFKHSDHRKDSVAEEFWKKDTFTRLSKVALRNHNIMEGSWINNIIWDSQKPVAKPKLILDLQDEQMLFEILDSQDGEHLQLHAGAMMINHSSKSISGDSIELPGPGDRFNISNDKFYSNRKISQQLKSHSKKRTTHGIRVLHSIPALKLQTMKVKLSNKDISNFHRPKSVWYPHDSVLVVNEQGAFSSHGAMKIILKSLGGKGSKLHVDNEETAMSVKTKASKKLDFRSMEPVKVFYSGKELEDHKTLAEQNVQPNALLHLVRTKLHLLPRAQKLPGENKSLRPPGAFKKKSDLSAKDGHVIMMEYCEERPLLLGNVGMGARLCTYYQKSSASDQTGTLLRSGNINAGSIHILEPADKSPFLGDIKPGCKQASLETNMFRAPIYSHKVSSTDYLLIRSAKGKLSIRRIDRIDAVGQQEPHIEVMSPGAKVLQTYIMNRLLVYMYREFRALEQRGPRPCIGAKELSSHFPHISEPFLRKRLKHCADLQRKSNGQWFWIMRRNFRIPLEEELRRMVTPEHVCAYESMLAGHHRLRHLGITRLTHPTSISSAMNQLPDEAIALAAASHIERELQITPWNLSSNFVACTNQDRDNIERLEITGVGDPSGRGLGFSYVRTTPKAPVTNAMEKKKTVVSRVGSTVTGTDADLRRLSMEAAREVLLKFSVPDEQISKLTRWHRIAMIRKLSSEQAASGVKVDPTTINKYARGQRMSFLQLQQQTREKCQEIWDRQVQSLSAVDGDENESDSEANSDLDSFAGDLENLLDAEEFEEGDEANLEPNNEKAVDVRGLKMRRHPSLAQAEEEMEDEAAEAAELCKILMDDDAEQKRKKKMRSVKKPGLTPGSQLALDYENEEGFKKTSMVVNQITSASQLEGLFASKENVLGSKEVDNFNVNRNIFGKVKPLKSLKNGVTRWGPINKKVKIVADGIKMIKEKKSAREKFICGACGQLGHMKTNKNCPRYREDKETPLDSTDLPNSMDLASQPFQQTMTKKLISKNVSKLDVEGEISNSKAKTLKVKCGLTDKVHDVLVPGAAQDFDLPLSSSTYTGTKSSVKVNKIIISKKMKPDDVLVDSHNRPSIIIKPPTHADKEQLESHRPSIVIRPPSEIDKDQSHKKIIIKRPREVVDLDQGSQDGSPSFEYIKTKKIAELSSNERHRVQESNHQADDFVRRKGGEDIRYWEEEDEEKEMEQEQEERENAERLRGERERINYEETIRIQGEEDKLYEIKKYEEAIRREREEEEHQKAKKKNPKKPEMRDEYFENYMPTRRNDKKMPDRARITKRRTSIESVSYGEEYTPPTKRRRGGEVGLSNILENIVETLKKNHELSALFQKPVTRKEAPDYLNYVKQPMDLSTIREKVRKMEYKSREDFRHDVWQIAYNAHVYNDRRNPDIPPLADQLLELCDYILLENRAVLTEVEAGID